MRTWALVAIAFGVSAAAQAADQAPSGDQARDRAQMEQAHAADEKQRADDMALLLGLRPDQRPAFERFQHDSLPRFARDEADSMARPSRAGEMATLPERLDAAQARADRHDAMEKERIAAVRQFYAGLTADQQRRFDALERLRREHEHGHHWGLGGHLSG